MAGGQKIGDAYVDIGARFDKLDKAFDKMNGKMEKQFKQTESKLSGAFNRLGGVFAAAFSVQRVGAFLVEAEKLAGVAEGVSDAFAQLDDPTLLDGLRKATQGTISDLELMKAAVRAKNFKVPLEKLASFFEFATKRSAQTGESVDYLVNSIVDGIGRKSTLVLDNLGISATELQAEIKKVGDFGLAAGNIIDRELGNMGDVALTAAQRTEQLNAKLENTTIAVGQKLTPAFNTLRSVAVSALEDINTALDVNVSKSTKFILFLAQLSNNAELLAIAQAKLALEQYEGRTATEALSKSQEALNKGVEMGLWGAEQSVIVGDKLNDNQHLLLSTFHDKLIAYKKEDEAINNNIQSIKDYSKEWDKYFEMYGGKAKELPSVTTGDELSGGAETKGLQGLEFAFDDAQMQAAMVRMATFQEQLELIKDEFKQVGENAKIAFGEQLTESFESALNGSADFFESMGQWLKELAIKLIAAAAAAALLAAIFPGAAGFGAAFAGNFGQFSGMGGELFGFLRGENIVFLNKRGQENNTRTIGG